VAIKNELLDRLALTRSVPGFDLNRGEGAAARLLFEPRVLERYQSLLNVLAVPYRIRNGDAARSEYPSYGVDASAGMVATARDLANFEAQLDDQDNVPISRSTLDKMWSQTLIQREGQQQPVTTPTGQGWFVQSTSGQKLVWTYGHIPDAGSALILKMPSKRLTLILLANSGGLAAGNNFEAGDVTTSPFVKVFLRLFI
jgi:CubicO group peptidase (beta-lactamase class C family)